MWGKILLLAILTGAQIEYVPERQGCYSGQRQTDGSFKITGGRTLKADCDLLEDESLDCCRISYPGWKRDSSWLELAGRSARGADFQDCRMPFDLRGADLMGANFYLADFHQADLAGADLSEANLKDADLRNVRALCDDDATRVLRARFNERTRLPESCGATARDRALKFRELGAIFEPTVKNIALLT